MKRGTIDHPKTHALAEALGIRRRDAVGLLEMLFHFTAQYAPQGDIGRYSDKRIAAALDWSGPVAKLVESLTTTGWVDFHKSTRLVVHDWCDHADRSTLQRLSRQGKTPIQQIHEDTVNLCTHSETVVKLTLKPVVAPALPEPEPVPQPEPFLSGQSSSRLEKKNQNGNSKTVTTTDDKPKFATPKDELVALMQETTKRTPEVGVVRKICETLETRGGNLPEYLADIRPRIGRLHDPPAEGFFLSQAKKSGSSETSPAPAPELVEAKNGNGRCAKCNGVGLVDGKYCTCRMGRDLSAIESRKKKPQQPQTEAS